MMRRLSLSLSLSLSVRLLFLLFYRRVEAPLAPFDATTRCSREPDLSIKIQNFISCSDMGDAILLVLNSFRDSVSLQCNFLHFPSLFLSLSRTFDRASR